MHLRCLILLCIFLEKAASNTFETSPRYRLLDELFGNVDHELSKNVLPLPLNHTPISVCFQFGIHEILDLNEKKQIMNLNIWLRTAWKNPYLKWMPDDFEGVKSITVEKEKVWVPDITLWNRATNDASMYHRMDTRVRIDANGTCTWNAPVTISSTCIIKIKDFPFDIQKCNLTIGSWRHPSDEITFSLCNKPCIDRKNYIENSEWSLDLVYGEVSDQPYYENIKFSTIACGLQVKRHSLFYIINMVIPCAIIAFLCCLTFYLPTNNGERISLVITVLLAMTVYMLIVAESVPPTSEGVPLVEKFYFVSIVETTLCLFATCIVVRWHENTTPMPTWVYVVFNCVLRRFLRVNQMHEERINTKKSSSEDNADIHLENICPVENEKLVIDIVEVDLSPTPKIAPRYSKVTPRDWILAAKVLNKFFFVLFILLFLFSMIGIFGNVLIVTANK